MNEGVSKGGRRAWAAVIVVFAAGLVVGGLVTTVLIRNHVIHVMRRDRPPVHEMVAQRLTGDLDMNAAQRAELDEILRQYGPRFEEFKRISRTEVRSLAEEMEARIRTILTPEQQARYDENIAKMHERFKSREKRH
jgi:Spy/CpxP family protein refolding chaperone